jgi:hypothetical protein
MQMGDGDAKIAGFIERAIAAVKRGQSKRARTLLKTAIDLTDGSANPVTQQQQQIQPKKNK